MKHEEDVVEKYASDPRSAALLRAALHENDGTAAEEFLRLEGRRSRIWHVNSFGQLFPLNEHFPFDHPLTLSIERHWNSGLHLLTAHVSGGHTLWLLSATDMDVLRKRGRLIEPT